MEIALVWFMDNGHGNMEMDMEDGKSLPPPLVRVCECVFNKVI